MFALRAGGNTVHPRCKLLFLCLPLSQKAQQGRGSTGGTARCSRPQTSAC